jgi:uncharacterized protein YbjT (DUF2867 family)
MAKKIVTIFGGSGFIGRYLVRALAPTGAAIRIASRSANHASLCKSMGEVGQIAICSCNVRDKESIQEVISGSTAVVNLTGILYQRGLQNFDQIHREAPTHMASIAADAGVKTFVHISAIGANPKSVALYSKSKGEGEAEVRRVFRDATIIRPSLLFGPEDDFFNRFGAYSQFLPALPLIGGGNTKFQPVYVCDVAQSIIWSLQNKEARGQTYELGGPRVMTFKELMELLLKTIDRRRLLVPVPLWVSAVGGHLIESLFALPAKMMPALTPPPPLTLDQVRLMREDNIVSEESPSFADMGISPVSLETVLPSYLARFHNRVSAPR